MTRRELLKTLTTALIGAGFAREAVARMIEPYALRPGDYSEYVADYLQKMRHYDAPHREDVFVDPTHRELFERVVARIDRLEDSVGQGHFQLLAFDDALAIARTSTGIGAFSQDELEYLEEIFYRDAVVYGFYGEKSLTRITDRISEDQVVKVPRSGHYLYKGLPLDTYERIKRDVGARAVLTSGVRGMMKQFALFLRKAFDNDANLSLASRSLAPPGYSFHGISDFDVGQVGLGEDNFTPRFTGSDVYRRLAELKYVAMRYPIDNMLGVRFEPWHIKVDYHA